MNVKTIITADTTLCRIYDRCSFKEKIDIIKMLDKTGVDRIVMPPIENERADTLLLHTVAPLVKNAEVYCVSGYSLQDLNKAINAVKDCKKPGITVALPTSTVQMEFICHKKAPAVLELTKQLVGAARDAGLSVEFKSLDSARSDLSFLADVINAAIGSGAETVTLTDSTGTLLPFEMSDLVKAVMDRCSVEDKNVKLGVECSDLMSVAVSNSISAAAAGASMIVTACVSNGAPGLREIADAIRLRGDTLGINCRINSTTIVRTCEEISSIADSKRSELSPFDSGVRDDGASSVNITVSDGLEKIVSIAKALGYELSDSDADIVFERTHRLSEKKPIGSKELEAVIASSALQVPPTYVLKSYVINCGNIITATAHVELEKQGQILSGISIGDGPIDSAFLSIEQITGRHFELDDFQIRSVTEGREAVGEALVKIRFNGKLYSGRGVSTDIVGASIRAYVKALNKICYEENV